MSFQTCIFVLKKDVNCSCLLSLVIHRLIPSDQPPYSDASSLLAPLPPQDCRTMYNPMTPSMTHGSGPGQGIGHCMDQYMRPPQAPPPHNMMGHRGMLPTEGESEGLQQIETFNSQDISRRHSVSVGLIKITQVTSKK